MAKSVSSSSIPVFKSDAGAQFWGYLHYPTNISENCVVWHLKVTYDKNRIDPICENCVIWHNLSDCVNRLKFNFIPEWPECAKFCHRGKTSQNKVLFRFVVKSSTSNLQLSNLKFSTLKLIPFYWIINQTNVHTYMSSTSTAGVSQRLGPPPTKQFESKAASGGVFQRLGAAVGPGVSFGAF
jgi:hypothetical protein